MGKFTAQGIAVILATKQEDGSPEKNMLNLVKESLTTPIGISNTA